MLFIKSKIQFFESKSQHVLCWTEFLICCLSSQRYNFLKANHNNGIIKKLTITVVYQVKDTIFWKQITTTNANAHTTAMLFIKSKIQFFESKSQRPARRWTKLIVVYQVKDTIFWKQITTYFSPRLSLIGLFIKSKIQFFESKSQRVVTRSTKLQRCLSSQRYNFLKANHNLWNHCCTLRIVVYQVKDTIFWKQITTTSPAFCCSCPLFIKSKIQFFESKSQQEELNCYFSDSCLSSQRYNFLKANHNPAHLGVYTNQVVYQVKDTIFWKQITTVYHPSGSSAVLFIKSKIQFFESKSQHQPLQEIQQ